MVQPAGEAERRYALYGEFASGGMAAVHYGRVIGSAGFARTVAIKRLHAHFAKDPDFLTMFLDEARLTARVQHPNVVSTLDVARVEDELFLVMEYVHGESLARLLRASRSRSMQTPASVAASIVCGALHGLHAAHEAKSEAGEPLRIVHRDVSPQNVLVGADGLARVLDFGVAKATGQVHSTREGQLKGKLRYMSPEQVQGGPIDRRADVYAAGVVLWELLTGKPLFEGDNEGTVVAQVLTGRIRRPSTVVPSIPSLLDEVVMVALSMDPARRFATARKMALEIESATALAGPVQVGEWVDDLVGDALSTRASTVAQIEAGRVPVEGTGGKRSLGARVLHVSGDSRLSSISASGLDARVRAVRRRGGATAGALGVAVLVVATIFLRRSGSPASRENATPVASAPPSAVASKADDVEAPPTPSGTMAVVQGVDAARPSAFVALRPVHTTPVRPASHPPPSSKSRNCSPPYTWESGVKVPKPECPLD
jgi:serine/threonine protein kinase